MNIEWNNAGAVAGEAGNVLCILVSEDRLADSSLLNSSLAAEWKADIDSINRAGLFQVS